MEKDVFKQILACVPDKLKKYQMSIGLDIYLTWCGIRTGCIPFDSVTYLHPDSQLGKTCILEINKIDGIRAIGGPYYDVGECIVIYNTSSANKSKTEKVMAQIAAARTIRDKMVADETNNAGQPHIKSSLKKRQHAWKILSSNKTYKRQNSIIHVNMGRLLGYECPADLSAPDFFKSPKYSIKYEIPSLGWSFGAWCPLNATKPILGSIARLNDITAAFQKLGIHKITQPELKIQIVDP